MFFLKYLFLILSVLLPREMSLVLIAPLSEAGGFTKEILPSGGGRQYRCIVSVALAVWYKG